MKNIFYRTYLRWLVISFLGIILSIALINYVVDPFFRLRTIDESLSNYAVSRPYNEIILKLSLGRSHSDSRYIFGDSRGNAFSSAITNSVGPGGWYNYSIGGASPLELISLVHTVIDTSKIQVDELLLVIPLRMYVDRKENRVGEARDIVNSIFLYLTNTLVLRASFSNLVFNITERKLKTQEASGNREEKWQFWLRHSQLKVLDWQIPVDMSERYGSLFKHLRDRQIPFRIVLPPVHADLNTVYRLGMPKVWNHYLEFFHAQPETVNCSNSPATENAANFKDPGHANHKYVSAVFRELMSGENEHCFVAGELHPSLVEGGPIRWSRS